MTETRATPRAMKNPIDFPRPGTTMITPAYASRSWGVRGRRLGGFPCGGLAADAGDLDGFGDTEELENGDQNPGVVDLIPGQAVPGGCGVRVVIVVPALAERE